MTVRLALAAAVAAAAALAGSPAHAVLGCDDNSHDIEVRYQDKCVLIDTPYLPPIGTL